MSSRITIDRSAVEFLDDLDALRYKCGTVEETDNYVDNPDGEAAVMPQEFYDEVEGFLKVEPPNFIGPIASSINNVSTEKGKRIKKTESTSSSNYRTSKTGSKPVPKNPIGKYLPIVQELPPVPKNLSPGISNSKAAVAARLKSKVLDEELLMQAFAYAEKIEQQAGPDSDEDRDLHEDIRGRKRGKEKEKETRRDRNKDDINSKEFLAGRGGVQSTVDIWAVDGGVRVIGDKCKVINTVKSGSAPAVYSNNSSIYTNSGNISYQPPPPRPGESASAEHPSYRQDAAKESVDANGRTANNTYKNNGLSLSRGTGGLVKKLRDIARLEENFSLAAVPEQFSSSSRNAPDFESMVENFTRGVTLQKLQAELKASQQSMRKSERFMQSLAEELGISNKR